MTAQNEGGAAILTKLEPFGISPAKAEVPKDAPPPDSQVPSVPSPGASVSDITATIQQLQAENRMLYDRLLRKQAELENMRRRMQREKQEYFDQANAGLIRALLPSLDAFERALKARDQSRTIDLARGILWHPAFTTGD